VIPAPRFSDTVTGMVAVVIRPGYSLRKGTGLLVAVLTPFIGPVQLKGTVALTGVGVLKPSVMFCPGS